MAALSSTAFLTHGSLPVAGGQWKDIRIGVFGGEGISLLASLTRGKEIDGDFGGEAF